MKLTLRLPDDLGERVRAAAAESQRSMNEWMVRAAIFLLRQEHVGLDTTVTPQSHQADTTPDQRTATADGPGAPDFLDVQNPPDKGKGKLVLDFRPPPEAIKPLGTERSAGVLLAKPACTCGPGERAKGKHNKKCPARGT